MHIVYCCHNLKKEMKERNSSENTLSKTENEYRTIFETTGTATIIIEEDMTISRVNTEFVRLSGFSKKQIEGKKRFTDFFEQESLVAHAHGVTSFILLFCI